MAGSIWDQQSLFSPMLQRNANWYFEPIPASPFRLVCVCRTGTCSLQVASATPLTMLSVACAGGMQISFGTALGGMDHPGPGGASQRPGRGPTLVPYLSLTSSSSDKLDHTLYRKILLNGGCLSITRWHMMKR